MVVICTVADASCRKRTSLVFPIDFGLPRRSSLSLSLKHSKNLFRSLRHLGAQIGRPQKIYRKSLVLWTSRHLRSRVSFESDVRLWRIIWTFRVSQARIFDARYLHPIFIRKPNYVTNDFVATSYQKVQASSCLELYIRTLGILIAEENSSPKVSFTIVLMKPSYSERNQHWCVDTSSSPSMSCKQQLSNWSIWDSSIALKSSDFFFAWFLWLRKLILCSLEWLSVGVTKYRLFPCYNRHIGPKTCPFYW